MNFPIPVNMTVDSGEAIQMTVQGDVTVSCVVDLRISPNVQETYDGPYSVTPSESVQTLETAEKQMTDNVTVGAISADYIGSSVPRKTSADLTASGPTVTAPAGYYASAASKDVQRGSVRVNNTGITANPSISVGSDGKIRSTVSKVRSVSPYVTAGYVTTGTAGNISVSGSAELQMSTQAAQTITPTESEQTAVAAGKYTTGIVKVNGIPSDYVGSTVTRKDAGTYTPSNVAQEIAAGQYLTGAQTISAIAPPYYDMGGALAWLGAGAELVTTFTLADVKLSATRFNTWTPSTTAADILATRNAGTFTATDAPNWNYFIVWETRIPIVYASAGTNKAKPLFLASIIINAIFRRPSSYDNVMASNYNNTVNATAYTGNFLRYYGTTTNSKIYAYNASYGLYGAATAATFSSATADSPTVTAKTPKISARCSTTYMSTANAGYIDKDKTIISQKGYVYKAKLSTFLQGCYEREIALVNEVDA